MFIIYAKASVCARIVIFISKHEVNDVIFYFVSYLPTLLHPPGILWNKELIWHGLIMHFSLMDNTLLVVLYIFDIHCYTDKVFPNLVQVVFAYAFKNTAISSCMAACS